MAGVEHLPVQPQDRDRRWRVILSRLGGALPAQDNLVQGVDATALAVQAGGIRKPRLLSLGRLSGAFVSGDELAPECGGLLMVVGVVEHDGAGAQCEQRRRSGRGAGVLGELARSSRDQIPHVVRVVAVRGRLGGDADQVFRVEAKIEQFGDESCPLLAVWIVPGRAGGHGGGKGPVGCGGCWPAVVTCRPGGGDAG